MNDEKMRELLHEAHADDRPPPFAMPEPRRRFPLFALAASLAVVALLAAGLLWTRKPAPTIDVALPAIHYPTDVLLPKAGLSIPEPTKGLLQ